jgi:hypothetical protein
MIQRTLKESAVKNRIQKKRHCIDDNQNRTKLEIEYQTDTNYSIDLEMPFITVNLLMVILAKKNTKYILMLSSL